MLISSPDRRKLSSVHDYYCFLLQHHTPCSFPDYQMLDFIKQASVWVHSQFHVLKQVRDATTKMAKYHVWNKRAVTQRMQVTVRPRKGKEIPTTFDEKQDSCHQNHRRVRYFSIFCGFSNFDRQKLNVNINIWMLLSKCPHRWMDGWMMPACLQKCDITQRCLWTAASTMLTQLQTAEFD